MVAIEVAVVVMVAVALKVALAVVVIIVVVVVPETQSSDKATALIQLEVWSLPNTRGARRHVLPVKMILPLDYRLVHHYIISWFTTRL